MSSEHLGSDAGNLAGAASQMAGSPARYIDAAPVIEVMFEQLEYLVAHQSPDCTPECAECARLAQVRNFLLMPFGLSKSKPAVN